MSRNRLILVTLGVMFSLFMAAVESTVVSTAMPTIVSQLGGLAIAEFVNHTSTKLTVVSRRRNRTPHPRM